MTSIKVKFRPSTVVGHEGSIYYQIIHERKVRQLPACYKIFPEEWDDKRSTVATTHNSDRKPLILSIRERIKWDMERLAKIDRKLNATGLPYTIDDVIDEFNRYASEYSLFNYMESVIAKYCCPIKFFSTRKKLGSIPFARVDPFRLLWFRQKSKTTDAQK